MGILRMSLAMSLLGTSLVDAAAVPALEKKSSRQEERPQAEERDSIKGHAVKVKKAGRRSGAQSSRPKRANHFGRDQGRNGSAKWLNKQSAGYAPSGGYSRGGSASAARYRSAFDGSGGSRWSPSGGAGVVDARGARGSRRDSSWSKASGGSRGFRSRSVPSPKAAAAKSPGMRGRLRSSIWAAAHAVAGGGSGTIAGMVAATAKRFGVPVGLAMSIARAENRFTERTSPAGAIGAMQVMPGTAAYLNRLHHTHYNVYNRADNIALGMLYLKDALAQHRGNLALTAADYNGGPGGAAAYARGRAVKETRNYVPNVLGGLR